MAKKVSLKVNDREIPMNGFIKEFIANVVDGMVDSLDNIPVPKRKIEIIVEEDKK